MNAAKFTPGQIGLAVLATLTLAACGGDDGILKEFRDGGAGKEMAQCVGPAGNVEWKIAKSKNESNPKLRIVGADMTKADKKFSVQWRYNTETKVSEIAYMGDGKPTSKLLGGLALAGFCL